MFIQLFLILHAYGTSEKNVCSNFRRSRTILSDLFYSMSKAYRKDDFEKLMAKLDKIDGRVKKYLQDVGMKGGLGLMQQ